MYSKYNMYLQDFPKKEYTTIYNLFTKKIICCKKDSLFPTPNSHVVGKLEDRGMIIDNIEKERKKVIEHFENVTNSKECLTVMLLLTGKCNFKCVYCYESEFGLYVSDFKVFEKTLHFIYQEMAKGYKNIHIIFYGGEPLLKKKLINKFSDTLYEKYKKAFTFSIVTNGSLLKKREVNEWLDKGLTRIKVTIDGDEKSHNSKRPYKNGSGSYRDVIRNLKELDNQVDLLINIVVDESLTGVEQMIDELRENGINSKFELSLKEPEIDDNTLKAKQLLQITSILKEKGVFHYSNIGARHGEICSGKKKNFFVIDMEGFIYGCNGSFCKDNEMGTIDKTISKQSYSLENRCLQCKYLPICFGECRHTPKCQREYFEILVPELLKLYIKEVTK